MTIKRTTILLFICFSPLVTAIQSQLVGTWASKSAATLTGAGFYNPVHDVFIEPSHTGISYSFTADGFYEEAYYRALSNPTKPSCPKAILQFQHGKFIENLDGSLTLMPFAVDGRQLLSDPCTKHAVYTRYNQTETMKNYQVSIDPYMKISRLDLHKFDGAKLPPMYLAYKPPQMLPTVTLNPTAKSTSSAKKMKRNTEQADSIEGLDVPLNKNAKHLERNLRPSPIFSIDPDKVWWGGIGLTLLGGAAYLL
ncbi:Protein rot1 [Erysiphe neolycopersici]|uniref:Protein ROT1 n=1 Tax=Erysiphe neolycopersici TaxID=212602 RepID=A0A420HGA9_9PEZI|nr:Protein rot1 [Erysiphe neolycopersici]